MVHPYDYSILIPTWKNLELLQNCIRSIRLHSSLKPQILVFVNEADEATVNWLSSIKLEFRQAQKNVGICHAMNILRPLVQSSYICYLNDDMYVLPGWDNKTIELLETVEENVLLSSTMIEPRNNGNACTIVADFGTDLSNFKEGDLLKRFKHYQKEDWSGSSWPPLWLSVDLWDKIGGFSEAFSPGMYSDPDLAMKSWKSGVRYFRGIAASRVYHFGSKSTVKLRPDQNEGRKLFLKKWGVTARYFYKYYLRMGHSFEGRLSEPEHPLLGKWINKLKKLKT